MSLNKPMQADKKGKHEKKETKREREKLKLFSDFDSNSFSKALN